MCPNGEEFCGVCIDCLNETHFQGGRLKQIEDQEQTEKDLKMSLTQNKMQYLQKAAQVLREHGMEVNVKNISHFVDGAIPANIIQEWLNDEWAKVGKEQKEDFDPDHDRGWREDEYSPL